MRRAALRVVSGDDSGVPVRYTRPRRLAKRGGFSRRPPAPAGRIGRCPSTRSGIGLSSLRTGPGSPARWHRSTI